MMSIGGFFYQLQSALRVGESQRVPNQACNVLEGVAGVRTSKVVILVKTVSFGSAQARSSSKRLLKRREETRAPTAHRLGKSDPQHASEVQFA